jgi:hypothetical protein
MGMKASRTMSAENTHDQNEKNDSFSARIVPSSAFIVRPF